MDSRLENCLNSLRRQVTNNLFNYTIILIDDGSDDDSGIICDQFHKLDPKHFIVFHKENGGVSSARNYGLDRASGDYISFVDPDDYVSPYYLINLYKSLYSTKSDISSCYFREVWGTNKFWGKVSKKPKKSEVLSKKGALKKLFYQDKLEFAVWGKLFKRGLFKGVRFPLGVRYEDVPVTYKLIEKSKRVVLIENQDYYYWQRENGVLNSKFNSSKLDIIPAMNNLYDSVLLNYPELESAVSCRVFAGFSNVFFQIPKENNEKNIIWQKMISVRKVVLLDKRASKKVRLGALSTYFGKRLMSLIYSLTQKRGKI